MAKKKKKKKRALVSLGQRRVLPECARTERSENVVRGRYIFYNRYGQIITGTAISVEKNNIYFKSTFNINA